MMLTPRDGRLTRPLAALLSSPRTPRFSRRRGMRQRLIRLSSRRSRVRSRWRRRPPRGGLRCSGCCRRPPTAR
jgi:hypothetical protein